MKQVSSYYKIMAIMIVFFVFVSFGFSSTGIEVNKSSGLLSFFYNPFGYLFSMFKTDSSIDSNIVVNDDASFVLQTFGYCGDGVCNADENSLTCPEDCGLPPSYCGDGVCNA
ncbi:MAG TPA: hypothetical protein PLX15_05715, partial [Candidatus Woesearchaeota archaeon]|nr:hypothetical protein [Candidatus Woesearchaeota archaeon]